jgi:hypothetical protein
MADLDWKPEFSLLDGLKDSYEKDFGRGTFRKAADFSKDDMVGPLLVASNLLLVVDVQKPGYLPECDTFACILTLQVLEKLGKRVSDNHCLHTSLHPGYNAYSSP